MHLKEFKLVASLDVPEQLESPYQQEELMDDNPALEFNLPWIKPLPWTVKD